MRDSAHAAADLRLLEECVRAAGHIARKYFGGEFKRWDKSRGNPVTEADIEVDSYLKEHLRAARPDYGWLSEETEDNDARLACSSVFVVDPIDGTTAFIKARPHFTICAGIVRDGEPVAGVVYNPISEECFSARLGAGAHLNGEPIHVSARQDVEGSRMLGDKPMFAHVAWSNAPNIPWPSMEIENRSSVAYRMALVANGTWDAMMALSPKSDWDLAAADIIVREAGGAVSAHTGKPLCYNLPVPRQRSVVAAGPALHARLLERISHLNLPN